MSEAEITASTVGTWIVGSVDAIIHLVTAYIYSHYISKQDQKQNSTDKKLNELALALTRVTVEVSATRNLLEQINTTLKANGAGHVPTGTSHSSSSN